jgi:hypothetical protein
VGPPRAFQVSGVAVSQAVWDGRDALRLVLTPEEQAAQRAGAGANRPTFAVVHQGAFSDGVIEVDVAATINSLGGANARGFAGIAFHLSDDGEAFEAVYLRMSNGLLNIPRPEAPRDTRGVQYVAHPGFHFETSRQQAPGRYERAAPVRLGAWHRLRLEIRGRRLIALVDGTEVLRIDDLKRGGQGGRVALWVGDGSEAYFRNLVVRPTATTGVGAVKQ